MSKKPRRPRNAEPADTDPWHRTQARYCTVCKQETIQERTRYMWSVAWRCVYCEEVQVYRDGDDRQDAEK